MSLPIVHLKGFHGSLFPKIWPISQVLEYFQFTESCRYDLKDDDQFDLNKLCGIDFTRPFGDRKAVMIGWRYDLATKKIELAAYSHDPKFGRVIRPLGSVFIGEKFGINIRSSKKYGFVIEVFQNDEWTYWDLYVSFSETVGRPVVGWFGGQKTAPHFMRIERLESGI